MEEFKPLEPQQLYHYCDPKDLHFETTKELPDLSQIVGQQRALDAVQFGIRIQHNGYNLYALGPAGIGKHAVVCSILQREATEKPTPSDWCYVYNFKDPQKPIALELPSGRGVELQQDMQALVESLSTSITAIFESEEFRNRMQEVSEEFTEKQEEIFKELEEEAKKQDMIILSTPHGFAVAPVKKGKVITAEEFERLPKEEKEAKEKIITDLSKKLAIILKQIPIIHKLRKEKEKKIQREFTLAAVGQYIDELKKKYQKFPPILEYFDTIEHDVIDNVKDLLKREQAVPPTNQAMGVKPSLTRYQVNVLVNNSTLHGAPVIYEDNPSYVNLIGRIEHIAQLGTWVTDFTLIRSGALHRANGGYLILDSLRLLSQPFAWEGLKRALRSHRIVIEHPSQMVGLLATVSLEPQPIPLDVKIILLGERLYYYMLCALDPDFYELFKVAADFQEEITRTTDNLQLYSQLISSLIKKENLRPFHKTAVARVIERSARIVSDAEKLTMHMRSIVDLLCESDYWASTANREIVVAEDVDQAITNQVYRLSRLKEKMYENIDRGTVLIDVSEEKVGQINGISVVQLGDYMFGYPARITAIARLGRGEVVDIEREVRLGGPIHSKGVLTLTGFIRGRYIKEHLLSLSASLVFEQIYSVVEGDSASVAELSVLLSAIADVPIKQSFAVTGSINQHGEVQAIGGVNEKIEGFFDVCKEKGLTGVQGVLIPQSNVKNLMLRADLVQAVQEKKFHIYPIATIDEAMTILTGKSAGERDENGFFPKNSVNYLVESQLLEFAMMIKKESKRGKR